MNKFKSVVLIGLMTLGFSSAFASNNSNDEKDDKVKIDKVEFDKLSSDMQETALDLKDRLNDAFAVDKSELNKEQKSLLKSEIKALKSELKEFQKRAGGNGGIYISTGGIIIIILLLIIIF